MTLRPPRSTLFPYTTLFRSVPTGHTAAQRSQLQSERRRPRCPLTSWRSEEHTSELQSHSDLVCRLLLEKKKLHAGEARGGDLHQLSLRHRNSGRGAEGPECA